MRIAVAGPYSSESDSMRNANLDRLNEAAAQLADLGHIPLIGINAALPVVKKMGPGEHYETIMDISMAVVSAAEAILMIGTSPGAEREKEYFISKGLHVFNSLQEVREFKKPKPY